MTDKLNRAVALKALDDIQIETAHNVNSGDVRIAGESRRDYLFSVILSQLLSTVDENAFNDVELAKLPTPDELASNVDPNSLSGQLASASIGTVPATPQPQTADQLADQAAGVTPVEAAPEPPPPSPAQPPVENDVEAATNTNAETSPQPPAPSA